MKKILFALLLLTSIITMASCINDEQDPEFEVLTPTDSTSAVSKADRLN